MTTSKTANIIKTIRAEMAGDISGAWVSNKLWTLARETDGANEMVLGLLATLRPENRSGWRKDLRAVAAAISPEDDDRGIMMLASDLLIRDTSERIGCLCDSTRRAWCCRNAVHEPDGRCPCSCHED